VRKELKSSSSTQVLSVNMENLEVGEGHEAIAEPTGTSSTTLELF
jgi:hypothetical protein